MSFKNYLILTDSIKTGATFRIRRDSRSSFIVEIKFRITLTDRKIWNNKHDILDSHFPGGVVIIS
jgi:hypothetical protein